MNRVLSILIPAATMAAFAEVEAGAAAPRTPFPTGERVLSRPLGPTGHGNAIVWSLLSGWVSRRQGG